MLPVWSPTDVEARILAGDVLVVRHGLVLRIPPQWLAAHPGGSLAILHFVGRDASDEIDAYHSDATLQQRMKNYVVARIEVPWTPLLPPVMSGWVRTDGGWSKSADVHTAAVATEILLVKAGNSDAGQPSLSPPPTTLSPVTQQQHVVAYRALHERIKLAGLYDTPFVAGYGPEILRYTLLAALSAVAYSQSYHILSAVFLGLLWHQLTFTAHDLGHCGVTHVWLWDRLLGIFVADFCGGISLGWWVDVSHSFSWLFPVPTSCRTTIYIIVSLVPPAYPSLTVPSGHQPPLS